MNGLFKVVASLSIAGERVPCSGFTLVAQENQIPSVTLNVAPGLTKDDVKKKTAVINTGLGSLATWNSKLQNAAARRDKCDITLGVISGEDDTQRIDLKDWVVIAAGVPQASANGSFYTSVVAAHPAVLADISTQLLSFTPLSGGDVSKVYNTSKQAANIVAVMSATLKEYVACRSVSAGTNVDALVGKLKQYAAEVAAALDKNIVWGDPDGGQAPAWAFEHLVPNVAPYLRMAIANMTIENAESAIRLLTGPLAQMLGFSLIPTYDKPVLYLRPFNPWGAVAFSVPPSYVHEIQFPADDKSLTLGVLVPVDGSSGADSTTVNSTAPTSDSVPYSSLYGFVPETKDPGVGSITVIPLPAWLQSIQLALSAQTPPTPATNTSNHATGADLKIDEEADVDASGEGYAEDKEAVATAYARYVFNSTYRRGVECSVKTRLTFDVAGGRKVIPGDVARIISEDNTPLFDYYITGVSHVGDVLQKTAFTELTGAFVRPPNGVAGVVDASTKNPLYYK